MTQRDLIAAAIALTVLATAACGGQDGAVKPTGTTAPTRGPFLADLDGATGPDEENLATICIVMIETPEAIENLEAIASVPGIDALYVGPNDLALGCGYGRATYRDEPAIDTIIREVVKTCQNHGIAAGVHCSDPAMVHDWRARGAQMLTTGQETTVLRDALRKRYVVASGSAVQGSVSAG